MGFKSKLKLLKREKRNTTTLREVIGTDLLTWKERFIKSQVSGLYSLTNEDAYYKLPGEPASLSIAQFERRLKEIDSMFVIVPCDFVTPSTQLQGHSIYFHVPALGGYVKVCNVGKNMEYDIPAESVGKIQEYKGDSYNNSGILDEVALLYRGWVAAEECCKTAYIKWENEGISPAMILNEKEVLNLRHSFSIIGYENKFNLAKQAHVEMLENDNAIEQTIEQTEQVTEQVNELENKE